MSDPLPALKVEHTWSTINSGHQLVYAGRQQEQDSVSGAVLDWEPATGHVRIWQHDSMASNGADPLPTLWAERTWQTIHAGHQLIYVGRDRLLDWEPASGHVRIWIYDRGAPMGQNPLIIPQLVEHTWSSIRTGHKLVYLGGEAVLDWEPATGHVRVWQYDRNVTDGGDPLTTLLAEDRWQTINTGHQLIYVGDDAVLDWEPATGHARVWDYDRTLSVIDPVTLARADMVISLAWVQAAISAILHYQLVKVGEMDDLARKTAAALETHFHLATVTTDQSTAINTVGDNFSRIRDAMISPATPMQRVSKAQAKADLSGRYTAAYTIPGQYIKFSPLFQPLDGLGDGLGANCRSAMVLHEFVHFVDTNALDSAVEWQSGYDTLPGDKAIHNPSSYACFAEQIATGTDSRFGYGKRDE
jgi:hypothetical protein